MEKKVFVAVAGNIGSGKSSLTRMLSVCVPALSEGDVQSTRLGFATHS